jgi:hypothetical protein
MGILLVLLHRNSGRPEIVALITCCFGCVKADEIAKQASIQKIITSQSTYHKSFLSVIQFVYVITFFFHIFEYESGTA